MTKSRRCDRIDEIILLWYHWCNGLFRREGEGEGRKREGRINEVRKGRERCEGREGGDRERREEREREGRM